MILIQVLIFWLVFLSCSWYLWVFVVIFMLLNINGMLLLFCNLDTWNFNEQWCCMFCYPLSTYINNREFVLIILGFISKKFQLTLLTQGIENWVLKAWDKTGKKTDNQMPHSTKRAQLRLVLTGWFSYIDHAITILLHWFIFFLRICYQLQPFLNTLVHCFLVPSSLQYFS